LSYFFVNGGGWGGGGHRDRKIKSEL
jgi:hypothetical protein